MPFIEIVGEKQLNGEVNIQGSKNAVLPILAATVLVNGITKINRCPKILDVYHMIKILEGIGCIVTWEGSSVIVNTTNLSTTVVPGELAKSMRSSIVLLGSLLGRAKEVTIPYPGGCTIGERAIDFHLDAMKLMNVTIEEKDGLIHGFTSGLKGKTIRFQKPSVGATQNTILAAVLAKGTTYIHNAAREPEITELCKFLNAAGAKIYGAGSDLIEVYGVERLYDVEYTNAPDRIVTGTYLAAVVGAGGEVILNGADSTQLEEVIQLLERIGATIITTKDTIMISSFYRPRPIPYLETMPYPGFPTDMQSQVISVLMKSSGTSVIKETIFDGRFQNVNEQIKFGADILVNDQIATVKGVRRLTGCEVYASELRGGAALVIAGLMAEGKTRIYNPNFIERGYEDICRDFRSLGARISYIA